MKTHSFEFIATRTFDVASAFGELLEAFQYIEGNNAHIFISERTSLRTNSSLINLVVISHDGNGRFKVDIVAGGGSIGLLVPIDLGTESGDLRDLIASLKSICKTERIQTFAPGEDYYNT